MANFAMQITMVEGASEVDFGLLDCSIWESLVGGNSGTHAYVGHVLSRDFFVEPWWGPMAGEAPKAPRKWESLPMAQLEWPLPPIKPA